MYVIFVYDFGEKRVSKMLRLCRRYLNWIQNSVFEGELTPATYKKLTKELEKIITDDDHVAIYYSYNSKMIKKQEIGKSIDKTRFIID